MTQTAVYHVTDDDLAALEQLALDVRDGYLETVEGPLRQCEACESFVPARQVAHGLCWDCRDRIAEERRAVAARTITARLAETRDEMRAAA